MSECLSKQIGARRKPVFSLGRLLLALPVLLSMGCNAFAPSALGGLTASRDEKRVLKKAAVDSFPSPADVGLGEDDEKS